LSGVFYLLSAFVAIVVELVATIRGRSSIARWRIVIRHSSLAGGIVLSISVAYSSAKFLFPEAAPQQPSLAATGAAVDAPSNPLQGASLELVPIAPVLMTIGVLALLLGLTLLLGLVVRGRRPRSEPVVTTVEPEEDLPVVEAAPAVAA
jgi:uncharacterized membrane protein